MTLAFPIRMTLLGTTTALLVACADGTDRPEPSTGATVPVTTEVTEPAPQPVVETPRFDATPFGVGIQAFPLERRPDIELTDDGLALNTNGNRPALISLRETVSAAPGQLFEARMVFDLIEPGEDTAPRIFVWALDSEGERLDGGLTNIFKRSDGIEVGEKTVTGLFTTLEDGPDGAVPIKNAADAASLRFIASPLHGSTGAQAVLKEFTVTPVSP
ncbi:MAG: hypothetical protein WBF53_01585 [Litorimonas sp.]